MKNGHCIFHKNEKDKKTFRPKLVDELIVAASSSQKIKEFKQSLATKFTMDDRGKLEWFLGMQDSENSEEITLGQETSIESVIKKLSTQDNSSSKLPAIKDP